MRLPSGNYISLTTFWWMYIKGNNSFPQCPVLQRVTAPDSDSVWHLLLKPYISKSRGLCKGLFPNKSLSSCKVKISDYVCNSPWGSYIFWESPNFVNQELSNGDYKIESPASVLSLQQDMVIHGQVWSHLGTHGQKCPKSLFHNIFYQKNKKENLWLAEIAFAIPMNLHYLQNPAR